MPERCFKFDHEVVAGVCAVCHKPVDKCHVIGFAAYHPECCPSCNSPAAPDRTGPVATLAGVQVGGLFE